MHEKWYENQMLVHCMIQAARQLDERYPDRELISLGHSPSWIIVTAAMIRSAQNRPVNTGYIPFSGAHQKLDTRSVVKQDRNPVERPEDRLLFTPDNWAIVAPDSKLRYFNYLTKIGYNPTQMQQRMDSTKQPPILTDYSYSARGMASFLDLFAQNAEDQGLPFDQSFFDIHLYKLIYRNDKEPIDIQLSDDSDRHITPVIYTETSDNSFILERLAGYRGLHEAAVDGANSSYNTHVDSQESAAARFMPYFSLKDAYFKKSNAEPVDPNKRPQLLKTQTSPQNIAAAKKAIRNGLSLPFDEHAAIAQEGFAHLRKQRALIDRECFIPLSPGWH